MAARQPQLFGHRYQLRERLGAGGMGTVYRAEDRLTGQSVALKRVLSPATSPVDTSTEGAYAYNLSLAREFRTLASLRHPYIIAVLDYGFDDERQPYFTMDLLDRPHTLTDAGQSRPLAEKVRLLVETLQALEYLHRRGIVHRDLKPGNVLVDAQGSVKVLDFGLSHGRGLMTVTHLQDQAAGTLAYMAPEVFKEEAATAATDLFAVGVMAYEVLVGRYPYQNANIALLINALLNSEPDYTGLDRVLVQVLSRLLAKSPAERYASAAAVIADLCDATGQPRPEESLAIRESYLMASQFVGREAEMEQLKTALDNAAAGQGSAYLIAGESGIGKSRLLDELRIRASVRGVLVLRGQGIAEGGLPYQLWREPLRRVILSTHLDDPETGILKVIAPDIESLVGHPVAEAPDIDSAVRQQQLVLTIVDVFKRQREPILLLLEDLQWALGSLAPLRLLSQNVAELPLVIVGSFRVDESPDIPDHLPDFQTMRLGRLSRDAMAELSASMLGEAGNRPEIVDLLERETEGNAFFMAEVVRALADEAGELALVGRLLLPTHVFAGEVQRILEHRLERLSGDAIDLLKIAAVAGRTLDLRVLEQVQSPGTIALSDWLTLCANAAVLEVIDGHWRFSHDKIREAVLAGLTEDEEPTLHRRVGEALEAVYPQDAQLALVLSEHWFAAGEVDKAVSNALVAIDQMVSTSAYRDARSLLERSLRMLERRSDAQSQRNQLLKRLGDVCSNLGDYEESAEYYQRSLALAQEIGDAVLEASTRVGMASMLEQQGNPTEAERFARQSYSLYRDLADEQGMAYSLEVLGHVAYAQDDLSGARNAYEESLALYRSGGNLWGMTKSLNNLGNVAYRQGDRSAARVYYEESLMQCVELGNRRGIAIRLNNLANLAYVDRDMVTARENYEKSLRLCYEIGDRQGIADAMTALGEVALFLGDFAEAHRRYDRSLAICRGLGNLSDIVTNLSNLGWVSAIEGDVAAARAYCRESLEASLEVDAVSAVTSALTGYARLYMDRQPERSAELVGLIEAQSVTDLELREFRLRPLLAQLERVLGEVLLTAARQRGMAFDLQETVAELLKDKHIG